MAIICITTMTVDKDVSNSMESANLSAVGSDNEGGPDQGNGGCDSPGNTIIKNELTSVMVQVNHESAACDDIKNLEPDQKLPEDEDLYPVPGRRDCVPMEFNVAVEDFSIKQLKTTVRDLLKKHAEEYHEEDLDWTVEIVFKEMQVIWHDRAFASNWVHDLEPESNEGVNACSLLAERDCEAVLVVTYHLQV